MQRTAALLAVVLGLTLAASGAQAEMFDKLGRTTPERTARASTEYWARTLNLTDEQVARLRRINLAFARKAHDINRRGLRERDKLQAMADPEARHRRALLAILTPEQRQAFRDYEALLDQWLGEHARQR